MKNILIGILLTLSFQTWAQNHCGTEFTEVQKQNILRYRQLSHSKSSAAVDKFIPLNIHLVGDDNGDYYFRKDYLIETLCQLNEDFKPTGFHFYINGEINYINNSTLNFATTFNVSYTPYKIPGGLNVFFATNASGACGYYTPWADYIVMANFCSQPGDHTLTHELGHLFNLPHTFSGWENGNIPSAFEQELVDGSNCATSGDLFCDTKADHIAYRWGCPYSAFVYDLNNERVIPDSSLYMSYSIDNCMDRFSGEQMQTMRDNLQFDRPGLAITSLDTTSFSQSVNLVSPANGAQNLPANGINFVWNKVQGAEYYYVQVSRTNYFNATIEETFTTDTSIFVSNLFQNRTQYWRVKPMKKGNICANYTIGSFNTAGPLSVFENSFDDSKLIVFPNPVNGNESFTVVINDSSFESENIFEIIDLQGKLIQTGNINGRNNSLNLTNTSKGLYLLKVQNKNGAVYTKKILIQ